MDFEQLTCRKSPWAWLDLQALDHNLALVQTQCAHRKLRLASKSIRSVDVLRYLQARLQNLSGLMSYCAHESTFLVEQGFEDILCAYPQVDEDAIASCEQASIERGAKVTWMVDKDEQLPALVSVGQRLGKKIRVCVDINLSTPMGPLYFGTRRSHISSLRGFSAFLTSLLRNPQLCVVGIMGYEAQIAGLAERGGGKAMAAAAPLIRRLKARSKTALSELRRECVDFARKAGAPLEFVNAGGSGSLAFSAAQSEVTEVTAGSAFYRPGYFAKMDSMRSYVPAAGFALPVTRAPEPGVIVVHSGGFVASGSVSVDKQPSLVHPPGLSPIGQEGFGEVQTPLRVKGAVAPAIGSQVFLQHAKAGELCEHFHELVAIRGRQEEQTMKTYRGMGQCFH